MLAHPDRAIHRLVRLSFVLTTVLRIAPFSDAAESQPAAYQEAFKDRPGTYYLTPGWVAEKKDPLGIVENDYAPRFGWDTAVWVMEEELKHYSHIALIDTGVTDLAPLRQRALENARVFHKEYEEIQGRRLKYFSKIIRGPYPPDDFITLKAGETVTQEMFL